ncbi:GTPase HflX [bacterium]|nr:GTPase HflX [bacterium]
MAGSKNSPTKSTEKRLERVFLVRLVYPDEDVSIAEDDLRELALLTKTAGGIVVGSMMQRREHPDPAYFIGKGKVFELRDMLRETDAHTVIFDDDLKPAQVRNLLKILGNRTKILDRSGLILDIFATHARTPESKIQVELAQLEYMLPRLAGMWRHLERQYGAIGVRGPGEKQIELDRRIIQKRISILRRKLQRIERERKVQRKRRGRLFRVALVGYTNAGKSSLLNSFAGASALVADKLFATLDATTRKISDGERTVLITDTVGFIKKLPHHLVESFKSTLAEAQEADLIILVADGSHPAVEEHLKIVDTVLEEIGASQHRKIAINKIDKLTDEEVAYLRRIFPDAFLISAKTGAGIDAMRQNIFQMAEVLKGEY